MKTKLLFLTAMVLMAVMGAGCVPYETPAPTPIPPTSTPAPTPTPTPPPKTKADWDRWLATESVSVWFQQPSQDLFSQKSVPVVACASDSDAQITVNGQTQSGCWQGNVSFENDGDHVIEAYASLQVCPYDDQELMNGWGCATVESRASRTVRIDTAPPQIINLVRDNSRPDGLLIGFQTDEELAQAVIGLQKALYESPWYYTVIPWDTCVTWNSLRVKLADKANNTSEFDVPIPRPDNRTEGYNEYGILTAVSLDPNFKPDRVEALLQDEVWLVYSNGQLVETVDPGWGPIIAGAAVLLLSPVVIFLTIATARIAIRGAKAIRQDLGQLPMPQRSPQPIQAPQKLLPAQAELKRAFVFAQTKEEQQLIALLCRLAAKNNWSLAKATNQLSLEQMTQLAEILGRGGVQ